MDTTEREPRRTSRLQPGEYEFLVVQTTRWYTRAATVEDAIDRAADQLADLAGTEYKARKVKPLR